MSLEKSEVLLLPVILLSSLPNSHNSKVTVNVHTTSRHVLVFINRRSNCTSHKMMRAKPVAKGVKYKRPAVQNCHCCTVGWWRVCACCIHGGGDDGSWPSICMCPIGSSLFNLGSVKQSTTLSVSLCV